MAENPQPHARPDTGPLTDSESTFRLLDRARAGDRDALEALFVRHLKPLQRWARGRLPAVARDLADTDDLVQSTLLQTFKRLDTFEPRHVGALQAYRVRGPCAASWVLILPIFHFQDQKPSCRRGRTGSGVESATALPYVRNKR